MAYSHDSVNLVKWAQEDYKSEKQKGKKLRHGTPNNRRSRSRGHGGGNRHGGGGNGMPNRAQVFDSNGPDVRIRGTAYQIQEKYMALAKDAASSGDQVLAESYLQHAEHYQRIINTWAEQMASIQGEQPQPAAQPPQVTQKSEDLGLPSSILGPKREVASPELADA